ncbi:MAG: GC-type dockerin domain-anchored protein [Planctomycetota bacterium]
MLSAFFVTGLVAIGVSGSEKSPIPMPLCACGEAHIATDSAPFTPRSLAGRMLQPVHLAPRNAAGPCTEDGSRLDILIVYTPEFAAAAGTMTDIEAYASDAIAELNTSFANSGIPTTAALCGLEALMDTQSGSISTVLENLRTPDDGRFDEAHHFRDLYRADLVCLFAENASGACGIANYGVQAGYTPRPDLAFSVVNRSCLGTSQFVFSHEIGHNLGLMHEIAADPCRLTGADPAAHAHVDPGGAFATIMEAASGAPVIQRFSDPGAFESGLPAGEAGVASNALVAAQSVVVASRFRDRDQDQNGVCDADQIALDPGLDCDGNNILDVFDPDLDADGIADRCAFIADPSLDLDLDTVPDAIENARLYVDGSAAPGGDGSAWASAIDDLQRALMIARLSGAVTEIWIAEGVYTPSIHRAIPFDLVGGVALYGGFAGNETSIEDRVLGAHETVLSGDLFGDDDGTEAAIGDNSVTTVYAYGETGLCLLDGLTITGGASVEPDVCQALGTGTGRGGGLFALFSDIEIRNCVIRENWALSGGGVYLPDVTTWRITDTDFIANRTIGPQGSASSAAAYLTAASPPGEVRRCRFLGNRSVSSIGAVFFIGGSPIVSDCLFSGNISEWLGPAAFRTRLTTDATFSNITVVNNSILSQPSRGTLYNDWTTVGTQINNSIFWNNTGTSGSTTSSGQSNQIVAHSSGELTMTNSTVMGWDGTLGGTGNDGLDPLFQDELGPDGIAGTADDDLRLTSASPAVDTGDSLLADGGIDLAGNPRIVGGSVDRGAYEIQGSVCVPDVTTTGATLAGQSGFGEPDGVIDLDDLGYYLTFWLDSDAAVADVTTTGATLEGQPGFGTPDGVVDLDDLGFFLTTWLAGCP